MHRSRPERGPRSPDTNGAGGRAALNHDTDHPDTHASQPQAAGWTFEIPPRLRFLDEDGRLADGATPPLPDDRVRDLYAHMSRARIFDDRLLKLQRQGRIGTFAPCFGQEACQVGSMAALTSDDWFVPAFREAAAALYRGASMKAILLYAMGFEEGQAVPRGVRDLPVAIPIGSQIAHAVGLAWAMKRKKDKGIAICFFGDGATSEGVTHESINFAAVLRIPTIFFCQNNQWAISTPRRIQTASETIAQKAIAHGIRGIQVDGNDVLAVYAATKEAADIARSTGMSTLIEGITFRRGVHTTADDPRVYRTQEEEDAWVKRDPIDRVRKYLEARGSWSAEDQATLESRVNAETQTAMAEAEAFRDAKPDALLMFDHAYAQMDPYLARQRQEAEDALEGRSVLQTISKRIGKTGSSSVVGELEEAE
ncbi:MAG: pyruvate dehydrogenase (acetyl-transferring) E1 component subunit alpha [Planctomycetes bacterium]|nr:pyruvate dehydrogenase (acetyl-transferring) E1 component subunit alpha [Planctomycetota bacterium]